MVLLLKLDTLFHGVSRRPVTLVRIGHYPALRDQPHDSVLDQILSFVEVIEDLLAAAGNSHRSPTAGCPAWAAAAASQQPDTKLVSFDVDEEHAGWFSGGFLGVILKSVTLDGWVVIGILMIMAVLSWVVMVTKTLYVGRLARANDRFSEAFTEAGGDFDRLEAAIATTALKGVGASSLYRIYRAGAEELNRRFGGDDDNAARPTLSAAAIATLRAVLDRVATREGQQLNRSMVLLTIAISGGPFLGLLGTVIGVMITFAAIAPRATST